MELRPLIGLIAGVTAPLDRTMGHSGAFTSSLMGDVAAREKVKAWQRAGIETVTHPGQFGDGMLRLLGGFSLAVGNGPTSQQVKYLKERVTCMEEIFLWVWMT